MGFSITILLPQYSLGENDPQATVTRQGKLVSKCQHSHNFLSHTIWTIEFAQAAPLSHLKESFYHDRIGMQGRR